MSSQPPSSGSGSPSIPQRLGGLFACSGAIFAVQSLAHHFFPGGGHIDPAMLAGVTSTIGAGVLKESFSVMGKAFEERGAKYIFPHEHAQPPVSGLNHDLEHALLRASTQTLAKLMRQWEELPDVERDNEQVEVAFRTFRIKCEECIEKHSLDLSPESLHHWTELLNGQDIRTLTGIEDSVWQTALLTERFQTKALPECATPRFAEWLAARLPNALELAVWNEFKANEHAWKAFLGNLHKRALDLADDTNAKVTALSAQQGELILQLKQLAEQVNAQVTEPAKPQNGLRDEIAQRLMVELKQRDAKLLKRFRSHLHAELLDFCDQLIAAVALVQEHTAQIGESIKMEVKEVRQAVEEDKVIGQITNQKVRAIEEILKKSTRLVPFVHRHPRLVVGMLGVFLFAVGLGIWNQHRFNERVLAALRDFAEIKNGELLFDRTKPDELRSARAYDALDRKFGLKPGTSARELPRFAERLLKDTGAPALDRALAAFIKRRYVESERLALQAKDEALVSAVEPVRRAIAALLLAAWSAQEQNQYARAMVHLRAAATLTSRQRDPVRWAAVQLAMCDLMHQTGDYEAGVKLAREVLVVSELEHGLDHAFTLAVINDLAVLLQDKGDLAEADSLHRRALAVKGRTLGPEHPDTLASLGNLANVVSDKGDLPGAESLYRRVLEARERVLGLMHPDTLGSLNNLAILLADKGDLAGAEPLYRLVQMVEERTLGKEHPATLSGLNNLANLLAVKHDLASAEPLFRRVLEARERLLGPEHPDTLTSLNNLANLLADKGDLTGAEPLYRRALEALKRTQGSEYRDTLRCLSNLATLMLDKGDLAGAEPLFRQAQSVMERTQGPEHPDFLSSLRNLARLLKAKGDLAGAEALYRRVLDGRERKLGLEHDSTLASHNELAILLKERGDVAGEESLSRHALSARESALGPEHSHTLASLNNLAVLLYAKGDLAGAEPLLRRALAASERTLGPAHLTTLLSLNNLAGLLATEGDLAGAEPLAERAARELLAKLGADHPYTKAAQSSLDKVRSGLKKQKQSQSK